MIHVTCTAQSRPRSARPRRARASHPVSAQLHSWAELPLVRGARARRPARGEERRLRAVDALQHKHLAVAVVLLTLEILEVLKKGGALARGEQLLVPLDGLTQHLRRKSVDPATHGFAREEAREGAGGGVRRPPIRLKRLIEL